MDLHPDQDQEALRQASAAWLADNLPLAGVRPATLWRDMAGMGWFGIAAAEANGGLGLDHATEALVFVELGRCLAPVAALATAVVGAGAPSDLGAAAVAGARKIALGVGATDAVRLLDVDDASLALVVAPEAVTLHELPATPAGEALDRSFRTARVAHGALGGPIASLDPDRARLQLALVAAAYALGTADAARDMAAAYASVREQFGRPIGSFQGVKHPCADMAVRCYAARAQLMYAACAVDAAAEDARFHVGAAKLLCDQAAIENARANIQVHGGIGMTDEALPHLLLKRAHVLAFVAPADRRALAD